MPFDFPASPSSGQVFQGANGAAWQWDGEKWNGGVPAAQQDEQFFVLDGLSTIEVTVPSWAKGAQLDGVIWPTVTTQFPICEISLDGTTWKQGATDYSVAGPYHDANSSPYYGTQGSFSAPYMYLGYTKDNLTIPQVFKADFNFEVPTSKFITLRIWATAFGNTAPTGVSTRHWTNWYAAAGGPLRVAKFRVRCNNFSAGSWLRVKWLGDASQIPGGQGVLDAPSDNGEYVRVNGVWRKKGQTFDLTGLSTFDIPVPSGARQMVYYVSANNSTGTAQTNMRVSADGTTFPSGASDYSVQGFTFNAGGTGSYANQAPLALNRIPLHPAAVTANTALPLLAEVHMNTQVLPTGTFVGRILSAAWDQQLSTAMQERFHHFYVNATLTGATPRVLSHVRLYLDAGTWTNGANVEARWSY